MRQLLPVLLLAALPVWAQQPPNDLQPLPAVPPPPPEMEAFDAALEPQVTIVKTERETREEYRSNGRLYMIRVTPAVGPAYYLVDQRGDGNFIQSDAIGPAPRAPMWLIKSW
ncbi:DUF2782 domain-containing protein [Dechloromonas sp. H13]|uniref:DUF2782 domain-containing protein n=1 Tax=Dechloromonas sp. H13 TaxID=2570193 RepID=UPI0012912D6F|nr:DUF2782 domain-containing protein [Dechloromonas sp. H13]